ncbi:MAG TPA: hypothetical protein PKC72_11005 [Chitinophagaceae bacterium]|nr:hypothetical protein [Chitinophagaceae bacterium]
MRLIVGLFLLISLSVSGQWKDYFISVKGDTLNRVDMDGKKQGPWLVKVPDLRGERGYEEEGYFVDDQKEGTWKRYSLQGIKIAEENYRWGKLSGRQKYFTYNGGLQRVENWRAMDPKIAYDTVPVYDLKDPTKEIDRVVVKNEGQSMKHGEWIYYDPEWGRVEAIEHYVMGKLQTDDGDMVGDDDIRPIDISKGKTDSLAKANDPTLKMIKEYEKQNSGKKKIKVRDGSTGNLPKP